jgi:integrase/recombinase XerC
LRTWLIHLVEQGLESKSVNRKIASLKSYYKFLLRREEIEKSPADKLKPLKAPKMLPSFVRESEMTTLLDQIPFPEGFVGVRDKLILDFLYGTGIRLSELINLKEEDINFYQGHVKVLGKRNKERVIPIPAPLVEEVRKYILLKKEHLSEKFSNFLIVTDEGGKAYPMMIYRTVKAYLNMVTSSEKKSPHVLRHTFATHLLNKGADLNAVKDLLGHANLAATQVYTHNTLDKLKSVYKQAHPKA